MAYHAAPMQTCFPAAGPHAPTAQMPGLGLFYSERSDARNLHQLDFLLVSLPRERSGGARTHGLCALNATETIMCVYIFQKNTSGCALTIKL